MHEHVVHRAVLFKNISGGFGNKTTAAHEFVESGYSVFCFTLGGAKCIKDVTIF